VWKKPTRMPALLLMMIPCSLRLHFWQQQKQNNKKKSDTIGAPGFATTLV
jgi:hypothetical protein